jgi:allophanate hydrolase subunit 2
VYTYLAVAGGFVAPRVLGSSSTDQLSGIGPPPIDAGATLHAADTAAARGHRVDIAPVPQPTEPVELVVVRGPRADWFGADALAELCREPYVVTASSSRVALRLDGPRIGRIRTDELRSEALVSGAIQLPPDGRPIVFGVDHPVTGGYPVLAVVRAADLDAAAQAHPGAHVRFRLASSGRRGR